MARANLKIKVGSYTGDGADNRLITGVGFRPHLVIVKKEGGNGVYFTRHSVRDQTNFIVSTNAGLTDRIQELAADGFIVGTQSQVNSNGDKYHYIAVRGDAGQNYFRTFRYRGSGADDRNFTAGGINFTPDIVFLQPTTNSLASGVLRTSPMSGDSSIKLDSSAAVNLIQSIVTNGFQLGSNDAVNKAATDYVGFALKSLAGAVACGTFVGTGAALSISGLGFTPDVVIVKNASTTDVARIYTRSMLEIRANSMFVGTGAATATGITSLDKDGFTVSTDNSVNKSGSTMQWIALKAGSFIPPISRSSA